jgi:hypothetical protein
MKGGLRHFFFILCWFLFVLQVLNFLMFIVHSCFVLFSSFFFFLFLRFFSSFLLPSFFVFFFLLVSLLSFFPSFPRYCLVLTFLCFVASRCYYMFLLSHFTLLLPTPSFRSRLLLFFASFMFHPNTTRCLPHTLPCYYLLPHASLVATYSFALRLLLPIPSFVFRPIII